MVAQASRKSPASAKSVVYVAGGVDPEIAYPLHRFLEIASIGRAKVWKLHRQAEQMGITLIRDSGVPTVRGQDYLDFLEKCGGCTPKRRGPGRPKGKRNSSATD